MIKKIVMHGQHVSNKIKILYTLKKLDKMIKDLFILTRSFLFKFNFENTIVISGKKNCVVGFWRVIRF